MLVVWSNGRERAGAPAGGCMRCSSFLCAATPACRRTSASSLPAFSAAQPMPLRGGGRAAPCRQRAGGRAARRALQSAAVHLLLSRPSARPPALCHFVSVRLPFWQCQFGRFSAILSERSAILAGVCHFGTI